MAFEKKMGQLKFLAGFTKISSYQKKTIPPLLQLQQWKKFQPQRTKFWKEIATLNLAGDCTHHEALAA